MAQVAAELGLSEATLFRWKAQDAIDRGGRPGVKSAERGELAAARRRILERDGELELVKRLRSCLRRGVPQKAKYPVIAELAGQGFSVTRCCRIMGISPSGYFRWKRHQPSARRIRFAWLTDMVRSAHADSRGTYGWRRIRAELTMGRGVLINRKTVLKIMRIEGLSGLPGGQRRFRSKANIATAADRVQRRFSRAEPDQLWVTDITEHPTREGKLFCCVVLDTFSRRVVGWSIDSRQETSLVTNALGMAIHNRNPQRSPIISPIRNVATVP